MDAVSANLSILKSPTVLRQTDGRLWAWEGCCDTVGSCHGSCTHVWNYAQAIPHLFPMLERTFRNAEFHEDQNEEGHQEFRSALPIRKSGNTFHAASDGQLGGIMKMYREWRIGGDLEFLQEYWPLMKKSLDYCIRTWDKKREGVLKEPHHNTYDIEFWGADGMCSSFYLGPWRP
ncbi:MAG TPA: glycoside hydrolase family 116 protein [Candidatus Acutalibacter stercoravium]|nr:glycoside hydrolase family 116 protein [Candidatus Acutalibacter stercoravium]